MIYVVNKRAHKGRGHNHIYIGRPSVLGNPYTIGKDGSREDVIKSYRLWLSWQLANADINGGKIKRELERIAKIAEGIDVYLICWCAPLPCHGDVLKQYFSGEKWKLNEVEDG